MNLPEDSIKNQRLVAVFIFSCILLNYPFIGLFNTITFILGMPVLFLFIFFVWFCMIIILFYINEISVTNRGSERDDPGRTQ